MPPPTHPISLIIFTIYIWEKPENLDSPHLKQLKFLFGLRQIQHLINLTTQNYVTTKCPVVCANIRYKKLQQYSMQAVLLTKKIFIPIFS